MTLSFGLNSPRDVLAKAQRDLQKLKGAITAQDKQQISDALHELAVAVISVKDWLKTHSCPPLNAQDVENLVAGSDALSSFRDIANTTKHGLITRYTPSTMDVTASAPSSSFVIADPGAPSPSAKKFKVKVVRMDNSRHEVVSLGEQALQEWEMFLSQHGL